MKRIILLLACGLFLFQQTNAQVIYNSSGKKGTAKYQENSEKKGFDPHKIITGGGLGFGFGSGTLQLSISPIVGYRVTNWFSAGIRLGYQYNWIRDGIMYVNYQTAAIDAKNLNYHIISPALWTRFLVWENIYAMADYEYNAFTFKDYFGDNSPQGFSSKRDWDHAQSLLLGAGLRQPAGANSSFVFEVFYDVLQNISSNKRIDNSGREYSISPYANTLGVRVGFNLGF